MNSSQNKSINTFILTMLCVSTILSIRNWPISAEYGLASLSLLILAALVFLIPVALISAELATKWPQSGGVFIWVKKAFGYKAGFAASWFMWVSNVVWYPTILSFISCAMAYGFSAKAAQNPRVLFMMTTGVFWLLTFMNLKGIKIAGWISSVCLFLGTILPGFLLIFLSIIYVIQGNPLQMEITTSKILPKFSGIGEMVFFAGLILGFAGMEMPAVHAGEVANPQRNFPRAIYAATLIIITLSLLGTFAIGVVLPPSRINLVTAPLEVFNLLFTHFGLKPLVPVFSLLTAIGALGGISTWIAGPSKALLIAAEESTIPSRLSRLNKNGVPRNALMIQAAIVTLMSMVFVIMPSINSSFWLLTAMASQLYLLTYALIFLSAIRLRYKYPDLQGAYQLSKANLMMWIVAGIGLISCFFTITIGFVPPAQLSTGSPAFYCGFLICGMAISLAVPLILREKSPALYPSSSLENA